MTGVSIHGRVAYPTFGLDLELDAAPGQVVGVVGPNGAGKTTLLRAIAGLTALTEGSVTIDGTTVDDSARALFVPPEQRAVGYVFQNYRLFPHLTVRDNIAFAPRSQGLRRPAARAVADRWIELFGLQDLAAHKPRQLSGGQAQRVALARALAAEPAVLLLDEPLAALDAETRLGTRSELRRHLQSFAGVTLLITHDPLEAMVLTDRLIVIENGRIVQQGTPAEIARRPATHYVARLVGLNLYRGTQADGHVELEGGGTLATASTSDRQSAAIGDDVLVALRPNAITIHTERPEHSSPRNIWPGTVTALELLTDRIRAQVEGQPSSLVDLTPDAVAELQLSEGSSVWLSAKATDIDTYLRT